MENPEGNNAGASTNTRITRETIDLSGYPDLVVIYLGMRVNSFKGLLTLGRTGQRISQAVAAKPDGLLLHENVFYSIFPLNVGMRQYWRDFDAMETWSRSLPHQGWWKEFLRDTGGTGFWHETYFMRGGMEAVYDNIPDRIGFLKFAPTIAARGSMFSARRRLGLGPESSVPAAVKETELYE
jgi:hypothetical protein